MKTILMLFLTLTASSVFAQREDLTIDDLSTINLDIESTETREHDIHYPNYRMGGGNGATRKLRDCLLLDIKHSDAVITQGQKMALAKKLVVETMGTNELTPQAHGKHVVFLMPPGNAYMTLIKAKSREGKKLADVVVESLPKSRDNQPIPTGLLYVRDCRF